MICILCAEELRTRTLIRSTRVLLGAKRRHVIEYLLEIIPGTRVFDDKIEM
jgi:hypothetical protein